jgi:site-specific DNA recombinase
MLRVCILSRVSTSAQAESGYSLAEQQRLLTEWAHAQSAQVVEHVEDAGVSGRLSDRPGLKRVLELAEAGLIDAVVVVKLDRLGRSNRVIQEVIHRLRRHRVDVWTLEQGKGEGASGRFIFGIHSAIAEWESEQIRARTMTGRQAKAGTGRFPNHMRPYGYRMVSKAEAIAIPAYQGLDGTLEVVEAEAQVVRELFRRAAEGATLYALTAWLNEAGIPAPRGGQWWVAVVRKVLLNPLYYGEGRWGFREWESLDEKAPSGRPKVRFRHRDAPQAAFAVPPLVDRDLWEEAHAQLRAHAPSGRPTTTWLLNGCVYCATCRGKRGEPLRCTGYRNSHNKARGGYTYRYYACGSRTRADLEFCGTRHPAETLEAEALLWLKDLCRPHALARLQVAALQERQADSGEVAARVRLLERQVRELNADLLRLADHAAKGSLPPDILQVKGKALTAERDAKQRELAALKKRVAPPGAEADLVRRAEAQAGWLRERLHAAADNPQEVQALFRLCLRVVLSADGRMEFQASDWLMGG